jgi:hypothetical protein
VLLRLVEIAPLKKFPKFPPGGGVHLPAAWNLYSNVTPTRPFGNNSYVIAQTFAERFLLAFWPRCQ